MGQKRISENNVDKFVSGLKKLTQKYHIILESSYDESSYSGIRIVQLKEEDIKDGIYSWITIDNDNSTNYYGNPILGYDLEWESEGEE